MLIKLKNILADIHYLTERGSRFGATLAGDEKKYHLIQSTITTENLRLYSLGRINPRDKFYFDLTDSFKNVYVGNCGSPNDIRIHITCDDGHPHYTTLHGNLADSGPYENRKNYKCHLSNVGVFTKGSKVPAGERNIAECILRKLREASMGTILPDVCGGSAKFEKVGRNLLEQNNVILGIIKNLNPQLHTNIVTYYEHLDSGDQVLDRANDNGIRVPNTPEFEPNTTINYTPLKPRRPPPPTSPRSIRKQEARKQEALARKAREDEEAQRRYMESNREENMRKIAIKISELRNELLEEQLSPENRKMIEKEILKLTKKYNKFNKLHQDVREFLLKTPTRPLSRQQSLHPSLVKRKREEPVTFTPPMDLLRARSDESDYKPKLIVKNLFKEL